MTSATFDALAYFEKLKAAGVPEEQAKVQASAFRDFSEAQEENSRKNQATKGDVRETELRLQKEIEQVRKEIEVVRKEMEQTKYSLLKWQFGIAIALALIMARGFGWLGF